MLNCARLYNGLVLMAIITLGISVVYLECTTEMFENVDQKYYLTAQAYNLTRDLFVQGRNNYNLLKNTSLEAIDTFLDLVSIMNEEMARELRSAVIKFYKIKYFRDFTNYVISMEQMIDITEHCLVNPVEKLDQIREHFHHIIHNFEDVRVFSPVEKCRHDLPDEVAAAHCILHQAVLFNETMQDSLVSIVKIKTRQHAQDMNASLYHVQQCLNDFVPKFFDQLLIGAYTNDCHYLKIVNASIADLVKDKWRINETVFPAKWGPLVKLLKQNAINPQQLLKEPLFITLFNANLTTHDILNTFLYKT